MSFWCITDLIVLWLKNTLETWSDLPMFVRMFVDSFLWPTRRCDVVLMHHRPDSSVIEKHFGDLIWPSDVCSDVCGLLSYGLPGGVMSLWCITDLIVLWLKNTLETWSDLPMFVRMFVDSFLGLSTRCDVVLMYFCFFLAKVSCHVVGDFVSCGWWFPQVGPKLSMQSPGINRNDTIDSSW